MSKDNSTQRSGGGAATTAGTTFQENTAAYLATLILAENMAPSFLKLPADVTLDSIDAETWQHLDDLELKTSVGGRIFIQCKTTISLSSEQDSTFGKVVRELVKQAVPGGIRHAKRILDAKSPQEFVSRVMNPRESLDPILNRCALIVGRDAPATITVDLHRALEVIRYATKQNDVEEYISRQNSKIQAAYRIVKRLVEKEIAEYPAVDSLKILKLFHVKCLDIKPDGADRALADHIIRNAIVQEPKDAERAWECLISIVRDFGPFRTGGSREFLRNALFKRRLPLRGPTNSTDSEFENKYRLQIITQLDKIRLYGIEDIISNPDESSREYPLRRAFVAPLVSPDEELSRTLPVGQVIARAWDQDNPQRLLFVGEAGTGKTTLVSWIALAMAAGTLESIDASFAPNHSGTSNQTSDGPLWFRRIPFIVRLRRIFAQDKAWDGLIDLRQCLRDFTTKPFRDEWFDRVLRDRAMLAIDGIDEVPAEERNRIVDQIQSLTIDYPSAAIMVTTRQAGLIQWKNRLIRECGFSPVRLHALTSEQIGTFVARWHDAVEEKIRVIFATGSNRDEALKLLAERRDGIGTELESKPRIRALCGVPVLAAMVCAIHRQAGGLPENERDLIEKMCILLLNRDKTQRKSKELPQYGEHWEKLDYNHRKDLARKVAYEMMSAGSSELHVPEHFPSKFNVPEQLPPICQIILESTVRLFGDPDPAVKAIYTNFIARGGLVETPERERLCFIHNTFKEFLAAEEYVRRRHLQHLVNEIGNGMFENVLVFAAGHEDEGGPFVVSGNPPRATSFVAELIRKTLDQYEETSVAERELERIRLRRILVRMKHAQPAHDPTNRERLNQIEQEMIQRPADADVQYLAEAGDTFVEQMRWRLDAPIETRKRWIRALLAINTELAKSVAESYIEETDEDIAIDLCSIVQPLKIRRVRQMFLENNVPISGVASHISDLRPITNPAPDEAETIAALRTLDLSDSDINDEQVEYLAASTALPSLVELYLNGCEIGDRAVAAIAASNNFPLLRELHFFSTELTDQALEHLAESKTCSNLATLDVSHTRISNHGIAALAKSSTLLKLRVLHLRGTEITSQSLLSLLNAKYLTSLELIGVDSGVDLSARLTSRLKKRGITCMIS